MRTRRVFVTLEVETCAPLQRLRKAEEWNRACLGTTTVIQAQANVAREIKPKRKRAKRKA